MLLLATTLLFGTRLGHLDFWAPDEPRYGAIAEELRSYRHSGRGLVLLHLNDVPYTQKPPLYFWLSALAGAPGGKVTEWAARLPSALAGVVCIGLTALIGRRLMGDPTWALMAAGLLATSFRFVFSARRAQLDVLLTCFELIAIALFVSREISIAGGQPESASNCRDPHSRIDAPPPSRWLIAGIHGALGMAALTKGPVGWMPLLVFASFLTWEGRTRDFRRFVPGWSWLLSVGPLGVWFFAANRLAPEGFASIAIRENLLGRFFDGIAHSRPLYYYLYQTPTDFLPWSLLLPFSLCAIYARCRGSRRSDDVSGIAPISRSSARFVLVWICIPLIFFSLSTGKRGVYLLPVFPALAFVAAFGLRRVITSLGQTRLGEWPRNQVAASAIALVAGLELLLFTCAAPWLENEKSPRPIARAAASHSNLSDAIGVYGLEPIEGAIRYYGARRVESLADPAEIGRFLSTGGGVVLMRERHLESLRESLGLRLIEGFRSGSRRLVLVGPSEITPSGRSAIIDRPWASSRRRPLNVGCFSR